MPNSIALANKYLPMLDEVYKVSALTSLLDVPAANMQFAGANEVKVFKITTQGLADYSRNSGFVEGDVTGEWETMKLTQDRGRTFSVDRMDNEETLDMAFGALAGDFIRTKVVPEVDAYRFAKYASAAGAQEETASITDPAEAVEALDTATAAMDEAEVPAEGRILFTTPTFYKLMKSKDGAVSRSATVTDTTINRNIEVFDNMRVIKVPQTRFYTGITLAADGEGGYTKNGADINFMILHPSAVLQLKKHVLPRIFSPDVNQKMDAWKFDYRIYHDAFTYENKQNAIYVHKKEA